jgi:hypothetical protein
MRWVLVPIYASVDVTDALHQIEGRRLYSAALLSSGAKMPAPSRAERLAGVEAEARWGVLRPA